MLPTEDLFVYVYAMVDEEIMAGAAAYPRRGPARHRVAPIPNGRSAWAAAGRRDAAIVAAVCLAAAVSMQVPSIVAKMGVAIRGEAAARLMTCACSRRCGPRPAPGHDGEWRGRRATGRPASHGPLTTIHDSTGVDCR
jgi:hypothetical protein